MTEQKCIVDVVEDRELNAPCYGDAKEITNGMRGIEANRILINKDATLANVLAELQNHEQYEDALISFWCGEEECLLNELMTELLVKQANKNLEQLAAEGKL